MNGLVIPHTPIAVDFWRPRAAPQAKLFFLSHMHTDHTSGLSSSWSQQIYCSEISARLLKSTFHLPSELVTVLEVGCPVLLPLDSSSDHFVTVTALDANHCPGSLMFLFQGYFGVILYTADFRYDEQFMKQKTLQQIQDIDVLYLDNTYCDPHCVFPSREDATAEIIQLIQGHPDYEVVIGVHSLGKEKLLEQIAIQTQQWIVVNKARYETLRAVQRLDVFSTNADDSLIRIVKPHTLTAKNFAKWNAKCPTIAVYPTAIFTGQDRQPPNCTHIVPYSDHSSYMELITFVSKLQPKSVLPIVCSKQIKSRTDMSCFKPFLSSKSKVEFEIPCSVVDFMNGCSTQQQLISIHRPTRTQRKRSVASGVVFSDSPLDEINVASKSSIQEDEPRVVTVNVSNDGRNVKSSCEDGQLTEGDESQESDSGVAVENVSVKVASVCEDVAVYCGDEGEESVSGVEYECVDVDLTDNNDVRETAPRRKRILPSWLDRSTPLDNSTPLTSAQSKECCENEPKRPARDIGIETNAEIDLSKSCDSENDDPFVLKKLPQTEPKMANLLMTGKGVREWNRPRSSHRCHSTRHSKLMFIRRPQVSPITPTAVPTQPSNSTAKTFYERFYVGRNCDFARSILFSNDL